MPTLADLRHALDVLGAEAPPADRTRSAVLERVASGARRPRPTPRSGPLLVVAMALLVALATVAVLAVRGDGGMAGPVDRPASPPSSLGPPPPATDLRWSFDLPRPPTGTTFRRSSISADSQQGLLVRIGGGASMVVTVHDPGAFDPASELQRPRRVTVAGRQGFSGPLQGRPAASLVWPTPEGGWAQLDGSGVLTSDLSPGLGEPAEVLAEQLSVAPLLKFGRFDSPRLPFRLGWLPAGISVQAVGSDASFGSAFFADAGPTTTGIGTISVARVDARPGSFAAELDSLGPDRTALTVGGRPALTGRSTEFDAQLLAVDLGDGSAFLVHVAGPATGRYPPDAMRRIVEEADLSPAMADPSTWIPASEAVTP